MAGIDAGVFAFRVGDGRELVELVAVDGRGEVVARTGRRSFTYGCNPIDWLRGWCP